MIDKRKTYFLTCMILLLIGWSLMRSTVLARELPSGCWSNNLHIFQFKPGENTLILQIVNSGRSELLSLKVSLDKPKDVNWLHLTNEIQVPRVPAQNHDQPLEVGLKFVVKKGYTEKPINLTLKFQDAKGNCWSFPIVVKVADNLPTRYGLYQNYPNPFNCRTTIKYEVPADCKMVTLKIFNSLGQEIRTLVHEKKAAGRYSVTWDGKDSSGRWVASGTYFYVLKSVDFAQVKKMTLIK